MQKKRILHLRSAAGYGGGAEQVIIRYILDIDPERFEAHCAFIFDRRAESFRIYEQALAHGIKARKILIGSPFSPSLIFQIRKLVKDLEIDIIHTHGYKSDISALVACMGMDIPKLATVHGFIDTDKKLRFYNYLDIKALRRFDRVITVNRIQKTKLIKMGVKEDRIRVVHNGVDSERFSRKNISTDIRIETGIGTGDPVVLYMGRLSREKAIDNLLKAVSIVVREIPNVHLLIAGSGPLETELREYSKMLNLENRVHFLGFRCDTVDILGAGQVFALSSETEGMPISILEAMSMQVPVVATSVGGIPEIMENEKEGFMVPRGDVQAFGQALLRILRDPERGSRMGENGRSRAIRDFSFSRIVHELEKVYGEIVK